MTSTNQINQWTQQQQSFDTQKQLQNQFKLAGANMLKDIYDAIQHIKEYITSLETALHHKHETIVLREDCRALNYLCECLERVLLFGFKKKFFRSSSIWSFISDSTAKCTSQSLSTDINLIKSIEVLNEFGKYRAFLRQSLRSKAIPLYFKLMLKQTDIIQDYYWDFAVMSQHNQVIALQAQLDELKYLPSNIEFEMLLSDKALNIMEYFKLDEDGVPQWNVSQDKGDITMMVDVWLLKNRDNTAPETNKNKHKKKHKHSKRKLNALTSTDDLRIRNDDEDQQQMTIESKSKKKKTKSKRKKKKKRKKKRINDDELRKQMDQHTTVIDDSKYIQKVLQKEKLQNPPKSPALYLQSPKASPQFIQQISIDDLIEEHLQKEEKEKEIQLLFKTPTSYSKDMMSMHSTASSTDYYTPQSNISRSWLRGRHRSSSCDVARRYPRPNSFIKGVSSTQRPYEIVVIQAKKESKRSIHRFSTPPPRRNIHRMANNRRYLRAKKAIIHSQSSSPTVSLRIQTQKRSDNKLFVGANSNSNDIEIKEVYGKPILSKKAQQFVDACSSNNSSNNSTDGTQHNTDIDTDKDKDKDINEDKDENIDKDNKDKDIVKEINQKRENDEYDTEEDTQQSTTYYQPFSGAYLAASEPAQYLNEYSTAVLPQGEKDNNDSYHSDEYETNSERKRLRLRRAKDEALLRSAMALDDKIRNKSHSHSQLFDDKYDSNSEKDKAQSVDEVKYDLNSNELIENPIPRQQRDRFSKYMTQQFQRRKRLESEDFSVSFNNDSPGNYFKSPYFNNESPSISAEDRHNKSISTAIYAHNELLNEGGSDIREQIKNRGWHNGIEISWRTTPLPPRDNAQLLLDQNFHCATCGLVLKSNFLRRAKYHYCRYLGLIHCNSCHKQERAVIPHRVLYDLDCTPATVCCASKRYLEQMYNIPCITLSMFSKDEKVQNNWKIKQLTKIMFELTHICAYLNVCRDKTELIDNIYKEYRHWIKHCGRLSLRDCVNIISFNTGDKLQILSDKLQKHIVVDCDMCRGKGYYCEICKNQRNVIYSFQYQEVEQCSICKACFHAKCWQDVNKNCPRCKRRQKLMKQIK